MHRILDGVGSVEELRIPARGFGGMGLRLLDRERRLWADHWVNARSGVLVPPPTWGSFEAGAGHWDSEDEDAGKPVIYRGTWDRITHRVVPLDAVLVARRRPHLAGELGDALDASLTRTASRTAPRKQGVQGTMHPLGQVVSAAGCEIGHIGRATAHGESRCPPQPRG